jgi:long-chain acyl-CoA synthetase
MNGPTTPGVTPDFIPAPTAAGEILDRAAEQYGPLPALYFMGRSMDYAELGRLTNYAAAGLQKLGVMKGTKVGLCLPNCPYSVIMYFAILKAGGTVVNFNPLYTLKEIETMVRECGLDMMVTTDVAVVFNNIGRLAAQGLFKRVIICPLSEMLPWYKGLAMRVFARKTLGHVPDHAPYVQFRKLIAARGTPAPVQVDPVKDMAVLQFTGGTTGTPKAAVLSHANVTVNLQQCQLVMPGLRQGQERFLALLPFFHVFCMTAVMNLGLSIGAELILLPRLDIKQLMSTLYGRKPTVVPGVPTLFTAIANAAEKAGNTDLSFIKLCVSGGAALSAEVKDRFERISGSHIMEGYGLSETSPVLCFTLLGQEKPGTVGPAVPGTQLEIRDPANPSVLLPQGETGEICARGPQVMLGYYNQPDETAFVFTDGAFRTGDVGYLDEDGCLFIVDRLKDVIICSGFKIYPRVIEEAAYQHPAVQDAVVIGLPDPYRGQTPKLYVTLRDGAHLTEDELIAFLKPHLNPLEIPKKVEIRESLPKTMVGKFSKKELLAEEAQRSVEKSL